LREAIRAEATERTWSAGVTLARDQRVTGRKHAGPELELEVRVPNRPTPLTVVLNPEFGEWECDCPSKESVCQHVVAAVIAAEQSGGALPQPKTPQSTFRYLLSPLQGGIVVERELVTGDRAEPFKGSLMSMVAKNKADKIASVEADLLADQVLGVRGGALTGERLERIIGVLAAARDVRWLGEPITTSADAVMPRAIIEDNKSGVRVRIEADSRVKEVVAIGVARTEDNVLRPIGAIDLSGPRLEKLPLSFDVPRNAFPELMGKTIPALAQRIEVTIRAHQLPKLGGREEPRMIFEVDHDGDRLVVMPALVYGDPPRQDEDIPF
jgi:hypothetical protein